MKKKSVTAAEFMRRMAKDEAFVEERSRRDEALADKAAALALAEQPLIAELRGVGCEVTSVWDLVNSGSPYPHALPVLLDHLQRRDYPGPVREGISRALAVRDARFAWNTLATLYRNESDARVKDALAVAIAASSDEGVLEQLTDLLGDASLGSSRAFLLRAFERLDESRLRSVLGTFGQDPDLATEIRAIQRRINRSPLI